ncbi:MAG: hypothetical protein WBE28_02580 [bacterium]
MKHAMSKSELTNPGECRKGLRWAIEELLLLRFRRLVDGTMMFSRLIDATLFLAHTQLFTPFSPIRK